MFALLDESREQGLLHREEIRSAHREIRELLEQDAPDADLVEARVDALGALQTEAHKARLRTLLSVRAQLSAEQWQALQQEIRPRRHSSFRR